MFWRFRNDAWPMVIALRDGRCHCQFTPSQFIYYSIIESMLQIESPYGLSWSFGRLKVPAPKELFPESWTYQQCWFTHGILRLTWLGWSVLAVVDPGWVLRWLQHPGYLKNLNPQYWGPAPSVNPFSAPGLNRSWIRQWVLDQVT